MVTPRDNTGDNIHPVQLVRSVHGTLQFGRFGRSWKHLCTGYWVEPFTVDDAIVTAVLAEPTRASRLSLGDRACLALAKRLAVRAVTADRKWAELDLGITVHLVRPRS